MPRPPATIILASVSAGRFEVTGRISLILILGVTADSCDGKLMISAERIFSCGGMILARMVINAGFFINFKSARALPPYIARRTIGFCSESRLTCKQSTAIEPLTVSQAIAAMSRIAGRSGRMRMSPFSCSKILATSEAVTSGMYLSKFLVKATRSAP